MPRSCGWIPSTRNDRLPALCGEVPAMRVPGQATMRYVAYASKSPSWSTIQSQRGARGARDTETAHQWHGTVMAGTDRDALGIQDSAQVVRVDSLDQERQDTRLVWRSADDADTGQGQHAFRGLSQQGFLVVGDTIQAYATHVFDGFAQHDRTGNVGGSGLEALRPLGVGGALEADREIGREHV